MTKLTLVCPSAPGGTCSRDTWRHLTLPPQPLLSLDTYLCTYHLPRAVPHVDVRVRAHVHVYAHAPLAPAAIAPLAVPRRLAVRPTARCQPHRRRQNAIAPAPCNVEGQCEIRRDGKGWSRIGQEGRDTIQWDGVGSDGTGQDGIRCDTM